MDQDAVYVKLSVVYARSHFCALEHNHNQNKNSENNSVFFLAHCIVHRIAAPSRSLHSLLGH